MQPVINILLIDVIIFNQKSNDFVNEIVIWNHIYHIIGIFPMFLKRFKSQVQTINRQGGIIDTRVGSYARIYGIKISGKEP